MPNAKCIDLSHWNLIPSSLKPAAAAGVLGVIHKCTEGSSSVDDKYGARRFLANDAGLHWGAYHFLRPGNMEEQARHFLGAAQIDPAHTLLAADHEDNRVSLDELLAWCEAVEELAGRRPVIYSGHVLKEQLGGRIHPTLNGDHYRLWLAQYGSTATLPPGWSAYWLWQWTDRGSIPGVNPPTDLNDYQADAEDLAIEWNATGLEAEPPPAPEIPELVGVTLSPMAFQDALAEAGFYTGAIDGESGPMTRNAVDAWFEDGSAIEL